MNKVIKRILFIIALLFFGILLFGRLPDSVGFPEGFVWQIFDANKNAQDIQSLEINSLPTYAKDAIKILNISSRRSIYFVGENTTIDIFLDNPYNYDYNLSVYWILNDSRLLGWTTQDKLNKILSSWMRLPQEGIWKSQVLVTWQYNNITYDTDKYTEIKVIK